MASKFDPVEEAKLPKKAKVKVEEAPAEPEVTAAEPAPVAAPAPAVKVTRYKVAEGKTISWYGNVTHLPAGTVVSVESYGDDGIARLTDAGVKLEPIK